MTKKGGSLTFPSNPLAAMQELSALDAPMPSVQAAQEETKQTDQADSKSYDNMTNKLSDKLTDNLTVKQDDLQAGKKADKPVRKKVSQEEGQSGGQSVAQLIRQRANAEAAKEVLKTVTLKISPTLDERIERYCFENKIKKQDFWAEAAALYFETVEEEQG